MHGELTITSAPNRGAGPTSSLLLSHASAVMQGLVYLSLLVLLCDASKERTTDPKSITQLQGRVWGAPQVTRLFTMAAKHCDQRLYLHSGQHEQGCRAQ